MAPAWFTLSALRLLLPLTILRWPLVGGIIACLADTLDVFVLDVLGVTDYGAYNAVDKALDTYYLALEAWVCLGWQNRVAKTTAIALFGYRLLGAALYEATDERWLLLAFPNLFELFYVTYLVINRLCHKDLLVSPSRVFVVSLLLLGPKLYQEYLLHVARYPIYALIRELVLVPLRLAR